MNFLELVEKRFSVRAYKPDPVESGILEKILEAVRQAPSACNRQPFRFIVINTAGRKEELLRIYGREWFVQAPIVICACSIPEQAWHRQDMKNYADIDVTIAMDHLILAATDVGLGTCWIGAFNYAETRRILRLPEGVEPVAFTPLGYPAEEPGDKSRKNLGELVRYERW
jgi:nitroreductase